MGKKNSVDEATRLAALTHMEQAYWAQGRWVAGADEAGRGPLAGPVVAAAVLLPPECLINNVNDSKKLSPAKREALYPTILEKAFSYGVGWVWPEQIDEMNILQATRLAFKLAYEAMEKKPHVLLVDGRDRLDVPVEQIPVVRGDALCHCIAAASIIAKVTRDRYMVEQDALYPQYGFADNKGYGTARHIAALRKMGPCPLHRRSFIGHFTEEV
ncbi:MAG: ribonuclease HII [Candidatus Pelethousia sp.]|nr:ribonuclease HII [Candidatus Pelethousia sp.]